MKKHKILMMIGIALFSLLLTGCNKNNATVKGNTKIVFHLEGGVYLNSTAPVIHYYNFEDGTNNKIRELCELTSGELTNPGYVFDGWFLNKNEETGAYSDEWDFDSDYVTTNEVNLYARWKKEVTYEYCVCYLDDENQKVTLGSYEVSEGEIFEDYQKYARRRYGYTAIAFRDSEGNLWDEEFTHPGGEESLAIDVYVEYIKGSYEVVDTAQKLKASKNKNIYLTADINLNGEEFSFDDYKGIFLGNGHKIYNFKLSYGATKNDLIEDFNNTDQKALCISLFGNTEGATIKDITFEEVMIEVDVILSLVNKIYVAPISVSMTQTTLENVKFSGTLEVVKLPKDLNELEDLNIVTDQACYKNNDSIINNFEGSLTKKTEEN